MPRFQIKIAKPVRFKAPRLTAAFMDRLGREAEAVVRQRIGRAVSVHDQPAQPLTKRYARYKQRKIGSNKRDWRLTGAMMKSLGVLKTQRRRAVIGFQSRLQAKKAAINQARAPMFGLSGRDQQKLSAKIEALIGTLIRKRR